MPSLFRTLLLVPFLVPFACIAQPGQGCFFFEDFEGGEVPAGWQYSWVETTTEEGEPTGEWHPAWRIGNAAQANAGGFFPVPDQPVGNLFIMANDDAPPCPCDFSDAWLITPQLDLSEQTNVVLEFRVFHDMLFGGGEAHVDASPNGEDWYLLHTIPPQEGAWQHQVVDMSAWSGNQTVWIRFRWSDNGQWATGVAIDDVCMRDRQMHDLSVIEVMTGDPSASPFTGGDQTLRYTMLPLEQAGPFLLSAEVMNQGAGTMTQVMVQFTIMQNGAEQGIFTLETGEDLAPGERRIFTLASEWVPTATGAVTVTTTASATEEDEEPGNNTGDFTLRITGPGWDDAYSAMALDDGIVQGVIGSNAIFIAGNRFEMPATHVSHGLSAVIGPGSDPGSVVRAILFDANMAVVDTSARYEVTPGDIESGGGGGSIYLPFVNPIPRPAGDVFAGLQRISSVGPLFVAVSGTSPAGASFQMQGASFNLSYPLVTPMTRLHVAEFGVGLREREANLSSASIHPNPANEIAWLAVSTAMASRVEVTIFDGMGRMMMRQPMGQVQAGGQVLAIDVAGLPSGTYAVAVAMDREMAMTRLVICR
jgi:hypothetical protein